jgi:hypothetical protein
MKVESKQMDVIIKDIRYDKNIPFVLENKKISLVKAEKVVNEPKKPIITNGLISSLFEKFIAKKIPIKKQPIKFTINVPKGNPKKIIFVRNELNRNLKIAPKKAPTPTRR